MILIHEFPVDQRVLFLISVPAERFKRQLPNAGSSVLDLNIVIEF